MTQGCFDRVLNEARKRTRHPAAPSLWLAGGMRWYLRATPFSIKFVDGGSGIAAASKDQYGALAHAADARRRV